MSSGFWLPCECGKGVSVTNREAGLTLFCPCGKEIKAPSSQELREMRADALARKELAAPPQSLPSQDPVFARYLLIVAVNVVLLIVPLNAALTYSALNNPGSPTEKAARTVCVATGLAGLAFIFLGGVAGRIALEETDRGHMLGMTGFIVSMLVHTDVTWRALACMLLGALMGAFGFLFTIFFS